MFFTRLIAFALAGFSASVAISADLPAAPEPVDYVYVCDSYGDRFYAIPGTQTCLRVSGRLRIEYRLNDMADTGGSAWARDKNGTSTRVRAYLYTDSRTLTELGLLRTYTELRWTKDPGRALALSFENGYIQWGGLLVGRADSALQFFTGYAFNVTDQWVNDNTVNRFSYTQDFGAGLSLTTSVEDGTDLRYNGSYDLGKTLTGTVDGPLVMGDRVTIADARVEIDDVTLYGGHRVPDVMAVLRADQEWGMAQFGVGVHQIVASKGAKALGLDSRLGWGLNGGVTVALPDIEGAETTVQAAYSDGALKYVAVAYPNGVRDAAVDIDTGERGNARAWAISGGVLLPYTDRWSTAIDASYTQVDQKNVFVGADGRLPDLNAWSIAGNLVWSPVSGFKIGGEVQYTDIDFSKSSDYVDTDELRATFRFQRTF